MGEGEVYLIHKLNLSVISILMNLTITTGIAAYKQGLYRHNFIMLITVNSEEIKLFFLEALDFIYQISIYIVKNIFLLL